MKYRIKPSTSEHPKRPTKPYRRAGRNSPRRLYGYRIDPIDLSTLFEISKIEGADKPKRQKRRARGTFRKLVKRTGAFVARIGARLGRLCYSVGEFVILQAQRWKEKRRARAPRPNMVPTLAGAFCAVLLVGVLSAFAVLYKLIFSNYFGSYRLITVPDLMGKSFSEVELEEDTYNIKVSYEYDSDAPSGTVIYQYPEGGVGRKLFSGGALPTLNVTVSRGEQVLLMPQVVGVSARDAMLELKNSGALVEVVSEFSDTAPSGHVISSRPSGGESFYVGQTVVLRVSVGRQKVYVKVPDICGLSENSAIALLLNSGLVSGEVTYRQSSRPSGTVISQSVLPGSDAERGESISFVVSAGYQFNEKTVPQLYGLTLEEAKQRLAESGLLCGNIYAVSSSEPRGTVVAQSPSASSTITSSVLTVDIYVSS